MAIGPVGAPVELAEFVRDPASAGIAEEWCFDVADILSRNDPRWAVHLVQRWFPERKFVPAFPPEDYAGLIWWNAAWSKALDIPFPVTLADRLHSATAVEIMRTFQEWANAITLQALGRKSDAAVREYDAFPADLWFRLEPDEQAAVILLVRRLAAAHTLN